MLRSLLTLLIIASLQTGTALPAVSMDSFKEADLLAVNHIPTKKQEAGQPAIEARSALVIDLDSGLVLYEKNARQPVPMASLTKIMTAVLIMENHNLNEVVTVDENYAAMTEDEIGVKIWLRRGERITVGSLLIGLLVRSGGDAALALAKYHSGSVEAFVDEMNQRARSLRLLHTHFKNPIGIDGDGHYSSAFDLAILTKHALRFPYFRSVVRLRQATITSTNELTKHDFKSTNQLLDSYLNILGVKTGTTDEAGESVINLARGPNGQKILAILLNSPDRFQENKGLIDWTFRSYKW